MGDGNIDRGKQADFDRATGEVLGNGAGIGNSDDEIEDYDGDHTVSMPAEKPDTAREDVSSGGAD